MRIAIDKIMDLSFLYFTIEEDYTHFLFMFFFMDLDMNTLRDCKVHINTVLRCARNGKYSILEHIAL